MDPAAIQDWRIDTASACSVLEVEPSTLSNWMTRYDILQRVGSGRSRGYNLSDLMKLAAMKILVEDAKFPPAAAAAALRPYASPYSAMLHQGRVGSRWPGTKALTLSSEGKWIGADGPQKEICIEIRAWPIFDRVFPRLRMHIERKCASEDLVDVHAALNAFEAKVSEIRELRWAAE